MTKTNRHVVLVGIIVAACGVLAGAQATKSEPKKKAAKLRVFFVEPKDGAILASPIKMKFGSEGIEIAAVPPGDIKTTRPGVAHYHVGIDQDCLPPGQTIVKGTPSWVHFGDGKDVFESQMAPGKHKLAVQLGDDLHNTMPGACQVITVTVK
jgi:hypothetical protein